MRTDSPVFGVDTSAGRHLREHEVGVATVDDDDVGAGRVLGLRRRPGDSARACTSPASRLGRELADGRPAGSADRTRRAVPSVVSPSTGAAAARSVQNASSIGCPGPSRRHRPRDLDHRGQLVDRHHLRTLDRDRQHLFDRRGEHARRRHRRRRTPRSTGDAAYRTHAVASALAGTTTMLPPTPVGQQRHHDERLQCTIVIGDREQCVRCRRQRDHRPQVDADRLALLASSTGSRHRRRTSMPRR